jgi:chromatin remodeling complex protein RSC6
MARANQTKTTGGKSAATTKKTTTKTATTSKTVPATTTKTTKTTTKPAKAKTSTKAAPTKAATTKAAKATKAAPTKAAPTERKERTRRVVNKDTILSDFDNLLSTITEQIELIKASNTKGLVGVKYMKTLNKQLKQLRGDVGKNIKVKRQVNSDMSKTSGFMKPVDVSKEVSQFAGWTDGDKHSRVDVTKLICNYVKSNDLQNPKDRRQILPDKKLKSLLKLTDNMKEPLTYYSLQKHIQPHFIKNES